MLILSKISRIFECWILCQVSLDDPTLSYDPSDAPGQGEPIVGEENDCLCGRGPGGGRWCNKPQGLVGLTKVLGVGQSWKWTYSASKWTEVYGDFHSGLDLQAQLQPTVLKMGESQNFSNPLETVWLSALFLWFLQGTMLRRPWYFSAWLNSKKASPHRRPWTMSRSRTWQSSSSPPSQPTCHWVVLLFF